MAARRRWSMQGRAWGPRWKRAANHARPRARSPPLPSPSRSVERQLHEHVGLQPAQRHFEEHRREADGIDLEHDRRLVLEAARADDRGAVAVFLEADIRERELEL